jgi:glycerate 2-kinase
MSPSTESLAIAREAIASIDLGARVRSAVADIREAVVVVAVGKAAPAMARAAIDALNVTRAVIVAPDGTDALGLDVLRASHPIPDERSVLAAEALLDAARGAPLLLALISGGASSLACAPAEGITLAEKQAVVRAMLESGAAITDVNRVRRHLSRIKGGRLAAVAQRTMVLAVSDVIGGAASDIGSGPASRAPDDLEAARAALLRFAPEHARLAQRMTPSPHVESTSRIIAEPSDLAEAAAARARARGYAATILGASLGSADSVASEYVAFAKTLTARSAIIRVAEPSVALPREHGRGGRAGRVALTVWNDGLPDDIALACIASDGVDGSSGSAGAVISGKIDARDALARYDDAPFLRAHGAAVDLGPTGQNLCDLHILLRA